MSEDTNKSQEPTADAAAPAAEKKTPPPTAKKPAKKPEKKQKKTPKKSKKVDTPVTPTAKLSNITLPDDWNRDKLGDIGSLVASLKSEGQLVPIVVRPTDKVGKYKLVDGRRRFAALQKLEAKTVLITVRDASDDGVAFLQSMTVNLAREGNTPYEIARSFGKLTGGYGMTNEQIAKACGRTPGYVSQHLAVLKADKKLQTALRKSTISLSMFRHFAKIDQLEDTDFYAKMMDKAFTGATSQSVGDAIDTFLERKADKAAKAAAKKGNQAAAKPAKKKGAAAHKAKSAPKLNIPDYRDPEVMKEIKMIPKKDAVDWLDTYRDKAINASTARKRDYFQGVLEGMEIMTGLLEED